MKVKMKMKRNNNKFNIVYKAENKLTGEVYIGATTNSVHQRQLDHAERAKRGEKGQFQEAIATYGPEAFKWTQIDTANSLSELAQKEKEYIIKYDSKDNGYNSDAGGGIKKKVYQYSVEDGRLINTFDCLESAANAVNAVKTSIGNVCTGQNKTCKGYFWSYCSTNPIILPDNRRKKVILFDLENNLITEYKSVVEASKKTGIFKSCIAKFCRGERKPPEGYKWKYKK